MHHIKRKPRTAIPARAPATPPMIVPVLVPLEELAGDVLEAEAVRVDVGVTDLAVGTWVVTAT